MGKLVQLAAVGVQGAAVEWLAGAVPELAWVGARDCASVVAIAQFSQVRWTLEPGAVPADLCGFINNNNNVHLRSSTP